MMSSDIMPDSMLLEDSGRLLSERLGCGVYFARKKGRGHAEDGKVCQDYCLAEEVDGRFTFVAVADGHGGVAYTKSDIGAKVACEVLFEFVSDMSHRFAGNEELERKFPALISTREFKAKYISLWCERVIKDYREHDDDIGLRESQIVDKYGTTILFAIITPENYILGQLGDGAILMFNDEGQSQLFRRIRKISSSTPSMASSTAKFAFVTGTFPRTTFNRLLLSTDGVHDVFSRKSYFTLYGAGLVRQVYEYGELIQPFTVIDPFSDKCIDVSAETLDDCTVALVMSDIPPKKYSKNLLRGFFTEEVSFSRAAEGIEFYETSSDGSEYAVHVLDEASSFDDRPVSFCGCGVLYPADGGNLKLSDGRSMYIYRIPGGFVSLQLLIDKCRHIEKKYDSGDSDDGREDIYTNSFWLNIYERLLVLNHEIAVSDIDLYAFYPEVMYVSYDKILLASDALRKKKHASPFPLKKCLDYFNIIGKLSFDSVALPLFGCAFKSQPINVGGKMLCQVVYDSSQKIFALWNISECTWYTSGEKTVEVPPKKLLRLTEEVLSFTADGRNYAINMYLPAWR